MIPLDELLDDHRQLAGGVVMREEIVEGAADVHVAPSTAMGIFQYAGETHVINDAVPVDGVFEISQTLIVLDAGDVFLVRQRDGARAGDAERRRERRVEELVVRRPHERVVDDDRSLEDGVLQEGPIIRDLVRDTVDDHRVVDQVVHRRSAKLDVLGDDTLTAAIDFFDERRREGPLAADYEPNAQHVRTQGDGDGWWVMGAKCQVLGCHPDERSDEGSAPRREVQIPRFARNDINPSTNHQSPITHHQVQSCPPMYFVIISRQYGQSCIQPSQIRKACQMFFDQRMFEKYSLFPRIGSSRPIERMMSTRRSASSRWRSFSFCKKSAGLLK